MTPADMTPADPPSAVAAAAGLARDLLAPHAAEVDAGEVPRSHLRALAEAGLYGLWGPDPAPAAVQREVTETLAGADCATWFVYAQHATPVRLVAAAGPTWRARLLEPLGSGAVLAGVAFSHLRRWPHRPVTAREHPDGSVTLTGSVPWCTGWGLIDVVAVAGATEDGTAVFALLPAQAGAGLMASPPLPLLALAGTRTVRLELDALRVPAADVLRRVPMRRWAQEDRRATANANPALFGLLRTALAELGRDAGGLGEELAGLRRQAYRLLDDVPDHEQLDQRLRLRAAAVALLARAATALVVAGGGRALLRGTRTERLVREAAFLGVQAQTAPARAASLALLTGGAPPDPAAGPAAEAAGPRLSPPAGGPD